MVVMQQMADLVHDDVFHAVDRRLDKPDVERDAAGGGATAPPRAHVPDNEIGVWDTVAAGDTQASGRM
jgi:hypothetical protein